MRALGLVFVASLAGLAAPAWADDKNAHVVLEPSTYWSVDFGEEKCRLARAFGEGEDTHLLFIEQGGPGSGFGFVVIGDAFERFRRPDRISVQFGEFDPIKEIIPLLGSTEDFGSSLIYSKMKFYDPPEVEGDAGEVKDPEALPRLDVEAANAINFITLRYGERAVVFETGNLGEAIAVLNECSLNFVDEWGLDRAAHESMTRSPIWMNEESVAKKIAANYPSRALRRGESAVIRMRVIVETDGSVSECVLQKATIAKSLDSPACREMQQAKFEPALDKEGRPMRSFYMTNIIYKLG